MNKIMFDILRKLEKESVWNLKEYARELYKPYSVVQQEYNQLIHEGYVAQEAVTESGKKYMESHCVQNAVILAAGVSSRFVPICYETPKPLLKVKGEVLIERQIKQLKEIGICQIVVVVGYLKEKFQYLEEKYGVILVETQKYNIRNNHDSVFAAREYLGNTIVTSADLYFNENIFEKYAYDAYYCCVYKDGGTEERGIKTDIYDKIIDTFYSASDVWVTLGYAYFNQRFSDNYCAILEKEYDKPETLGKFWADIQDEHLDELFMYANRIKNNVIYEFDSLEELREFEPNYRYESERNALHRIAEMLNVEQSELHDFSPITKEDLGRGFTFICQQNKYICRMEQDLSVKELKRYDEEIQELVDLINSFEMYYEFTLPLCAAENVMSDFAKMPLSMGFQERYIVGNTYSYEEGDNFIGSTYLLPFYQMISEKCEKIFHAKYTDARTLTGMNCLMTVLASLAKSGERIYILGAAAGGHASVRPIAERLGLDVEEVPFDYEMMDLKYDILNEKLNEGGINYILLAPSDIIRPFQVEKLKLKDTILLYDVSQMLGLIGAGLIKNPLDDLENIVIFGGTHKTFPGPASGLILTNNERIHEKLERTINPIYIRNTQMHQKVSLLFTMIEFETLGGAYEEHIVELANALSMELEKIGFQVGKADEEKWSYTHEVFLYTDKEMMDRIYNNAKRYRITLNKKKKELFRGFGIRLGTQEIARYGWPTSSMKNVANIIFELSKEDTDDEKMRKMLADLPEKKMQYVFDASVMKRFSVI